MFEGNDEFSGKAGGFYAAAIEEEGEAFAVALAAAVDVGHEEAPVVTEETQGVAQGTQVAFEFLDGDDVEAGEDFDDGAKAPQVAFGAVVVTCGPFAGEGGEGADIPGGDQEVVGLFGRDLLSEGLAEAIEFLLDVARGQVGDGGAIA